MEHSELEARVLRLESTLRQALLMIADSLEAINDRMDDIEDIISDEFREAYGQMKRGESEEVGLGSGSLDFVHEGQEEPQGASGASEESA